MDTGEGGQTFHFLFSDHTTPMWIHEQETLAFLEVNNAALEKYGYTREEFLGLTHGDIGMASDIARPLKDAKQEHLFMQQSGEWRHKLKNGEIIDVEITLQTLEFDGRKSVLVMAQDITKRKRIMDALQESEAHYRALVEGTPVIVYSFSNKRGGIYFSEHVTDILGYSPEQLYAQPMLWRNSVHPDDLPSLNQRDLIAVAGKTVRVEYRILDARGNWHWFDDRAFKYQTEEGESIIEGRALDITERKLADAALLESEERYHTLFDRMMDGIYRSTREGRFVDVNPAMVKMFGFASKEEMLAVDIKNELYFTPEERGSHILDTGQEEMEVYRMRRKDGSEIWVEDHGYYVHDKQGNRIYHEGMLRDITQRKQAEDELRHAKDSLENAHRELQQSLSHEQLLARTDGLTGLYNRRHFFELAEREFKAASRFRNPLAIIMFDADHLKQVNDTFGHSVGDRLLVQIAQASETQVRAVDVLARYGGDEFILLLPQTNAKQALFIAERIRESMAAARVEADQILLSVTLSIGISDMLRDSDDESIERVIQRADKALYAAKTEGRNRTIVFPSDGSINS